MYLRACATFTFHLGAQDRKRLYVAVADALTRGEDHLDLGPGWTLDVASLSRDLHERITAFDAWRESLVVRADILGGEPVFPSSRLAVVESRNSGGRDPETLAVGDTVIRRDLVVNRLAPPSR